MAASEPIAFETITKNHKATDGRWTIVCRAHYAVWKQQRRTTRLCTLLSSRPGLCGQGVCETTTKNYKGLSEVLVAVATLIQMFIDWKQSNAMGLENVSLKLKLAVVAAAVLTLTAFLLGLLPITRGKVGRCGEEETVFAEH